MVYPPWESLASASPRPNFPKSHIDVVDPIHNWLRQRKLVSVKFMQYRQYICQALQ